MTRATGKRLASIGTISRAANIRLTSIWPAIVSIAFLARRRERAGQVRSNEFGDPYTRQQRLQPRAARQVRNEQPRVTQTGTRSNFRAWTQGEQYRRADRKATEFRPGLATRGPKQDVVPGGAREHPRTHFSRADFRRENVFGMQHPCPLQRKEGPLASLRVFTPACCRSALPR